jgi:hypothetical protein
MVNALRRFFHDELPRSSIRVWSTLGWAIEVWMA